MTLKNTPLDLAPLRILDAEPFYVRRKLSVRKFAKLISDDTSLPYEELIEGIIKKMADLTIPDEAERARFTALWDGDDYTDDVLSQARKDLLSIVGGRPTDEASPSGGGSGTPSTGEPSTHASSSPEGQDSKLSLAT